MCQSCADGGRRCRTDTTLARRHRRKMSKTLENISSTKPNQTYSVPPVTAFASVEELKQQAQSLAVELHTPPVDNEEEQDRIDSALEVKVTALGMAIALEAEKRAGFDLAKYKLDFDAVSEDLEEATEAIVDSEDAFADVQERYNLWVEANGDITDESNPLHEEWVALKQEYVDAEKNLKEAADNYNVVSEADDERRNKIYADQIAKLTAAYRETIADIREVGGTISAGTHSNEKATEILNETIGKYYPSAWIEASNNKGDNLRVKISEGRAHYVGGIRQNDLTPEDNPEDAVEKYEYYYAVPVPLTEIEATRETLGEEAQILDGRKININDVECKILQMPHQRIFDPTQDEANEDGTPKGEGWKMAHYISPSTGKLSETKKWVRTTPKVVKVMRPEILVPENVDTVAAQATTFHEFAHRVEGTVGNGVIMRQEEAWLRRRTTDPVTGVREDTSYIYPPKPGSGILDAEIGRRGTFVHHYVGKEYVSNGHREVLSIGAEALFAGSFSALMGLDGETKADADHKGFILGIFATA